MGSSDSEMHPGISRAIHLRSRPAFLPAPEDFEIVAAPIPELTEGQLLVRNLFFSVDPYKRGRMVERAGGKGFQLGEPLDGPCVGRVAQSKCAGLDKGDYVLGEKGWREYFVCAASGVTKIESDQTPVQAYLGVLGMTGFTAFLGLCDVGRLRCGESVFVSAAAGAVGSVVCQIAALKGCTVVGSAGSEEKVRWLQEHGGIAAFNYRTAGSIASAVRQCCPDGIDLYFDNVGGPHLEGALECMNTFGRIVLCGMMSKMDESSRPFGLTNLNLAIRKRLTLTGFRASDHMHRYTEFSSDMRRWIREGKIAWTETIVDGLENAPRAFLGLFKGENLGKMLVRV